MFKVIAEEIKIAKRNPELADQLIKEIGPRLEEIVITYASFSLNRYSLKSDKLFGKPYSSERYQIVKISGNTVFWKQVGDYKVYQDKIDDLLSKWDREGIREITQFEQLFETIKKTLTPFLGGAIVGALISWLMGRLK